MSDIERARAKREEKSHPFRGIDRTFAPSMLEPLPPPGCATIADALAFFESMIPAANARQAHNASGLTDAREGGRSATSATSAPGRSERETPG